MPINATTGKVLALVMAGGAGSRLGPLTDKRAKPAVRFGGAYRLIDFPLSNCAHSQLSNVWVLQQYEPYFLSEHLANGRPWDLDRTFGGLLVLHPHTGDAREGFNQGNADAIHRQAKVIDEFGPDVVLVLSADHVYRLDYRDVLAAHRDAEADLTVVTTRVPLAEAGRSGTVEVDGSGRVTAFDYKPDEPKSDLVTTEVFAYTWARLREALADLAAEGEVEGSDFGDALVPRLVADGGVREHRLEGYWRDAGTIDSYWQGHLDLLAGGPGLRLDDPAWPVLTAAGHRLPARIGARGVLEDSLVAPGCVVSGRVARSVLAPGVTVEAGAEVCDAVLLDDVVVAAGARVRGAVLDEGVTVGRGAVVGDLDADGPLAPDRLVVVGLRAGISEGAHLAPGARLPPA